MEDQNLALGEQMKQVIRNQIRLNKPTVTKETFQRLQSEGINKEEATRLMACILTNELVAISKEQKPFNEERYAQWMRDLPKLPWD